MPNKLSYYYEYSSEKIRKDRQTHREYGSVNIYYVKNKTNMNHTRKEETNNKGFLTGMQVL